MLYCEALAISFVPFYGRLVYSTCSVDLLTVVASSRDQIKDRVTNPATLTKQRDFFLTRYGP
jgi:hypothetical protein